MIFTRNNRRLFLLGGMLIAGMILAGCRSPGSAPELFTPVDRRPKICPDYTDLVIPPNIAPMNFEIAEKGDAFITVIEGDNGAHWTASGRSVQIPKDFWRRMLEGTLDKNPAKSFTLTIYSKEGDRWNQWTPIRNRIADDPADSRLAYRLIEPGYEHHGQIQLVQRDISSFDERPFFDNDASQGTCANCHSFQNYRTDRFLFHTRGKNGGTILSLDGKVKKVQARLPKTPMNAVYPSWHPVLPLVAFSTNQTIQYFHSASPNRIEVLDRESDLMLYDAEKNTMRRIDETPDLLETFPSWAPDGKSLYYCAAPLGSIPVSEKTGERDWQKEYNKIQYNVMRRPFDAETGSFGPPETVFDAQKEGKSAVHPRLSPDGRYMVFTASRYGTFPIWHRESDLYLLDFTTGAVRPLDEINSPESESYHSWNSTGKWMVFSSRREDGLYTRLYMAHWEDGHFSKPFILPQKYAAENQRRMKSYNVPEWITEPIPVSTGKLMRTVRLAPGQEPADAALNQ